MIRNSRGIFSGVGVIIVAVLVTVTALSVGLNNRCQSGFWDNQLVYPGAELTEQDAVFLGVQRVVYYTTDTEGAVNDWYNAQRASQMRAMVESGNFADTRTANWLLAPAEGREGTTITFQTVCP